MSLIAKHFNELLAMDWQTICVIAVLCGLASYFIKEYLANPPLIIFVYPVLVLLSILIQYSFSQAQLYAPKKIDQWLMWTILASICGTFIGIVLVALLAIMRDRAGMRRA